MVLAETAPDRKRPRPSVPAPEKPHQGVLGDSKLTELGSPVYVNQYYEKNLTTGVETTHYYLGGRQIAYKKGDTLEYPLDDHLLSTVGTMDDQGNKISTVKYFPFGGTRFSTGETGTDKMFTGQRLDQTGLYFYNARYYDAEIGRFISPDTIVPKWTNPQSLNRYSYCLNNPLKYVDPSGHLYGITQEDIMEYAIENPDSEYLTDEGREFAQKMTESPSTCLEAVTSESIDSDWGDVLGSASWGDRVHLQNEDGYVTDFVLEPGLDTARTLQEWAVKTTISRDQGDIHTLRLYSGETGDRLRKAKLDDGHKTGDRLKRFGELVGGVVLATTGGVAMLVGGLSFAIPGIGTLAGIGLTSVGGLATSAGWEMTRDAVYNLSAGQYGDPLTVSDLDEIAWGAFPVTTSYGPWGYTPTGGWNGP